MAKPRKVGGTQEVFIQLDPQTANIEQIISTIEELKGRVLHAYAPIAMVAALAPNSIKRLSTLPGIRSTTTGIFDNKSMQALATDRMLGFAIAAWNNHFSPARRDQFAAAAANALPWNATGHLPPHPPADIMNEFRRREAELQPKPAQPDGAQGFLQTPNFSIPVLVGRIGVGVIFVDSTVAEFAITDQEKSKVINEITEGLNMLSGFEPRANIQWFYDFKRPRLSLTASQFPATQQNSWEDTWRNAAMSALGFTADLNGMNQYANDVKTRVGAQHAYTIFVTKYPKVWFAYEWGNHVVMDFQVDGWGIDNFNLVIAHETGHVFGCPDEYTADCNCSALFGRYQVPNGNCQACSSAACLMKGNTPSVCDFTRGHLGWNDLAFQSAGTTTLKGTWTFDLDSGVQGPTSGSDLWWEQVDGTVRYLVPQGGASFAYLGQPNFDAVSRQTLQAQSYSAAPINGSNNGFNRLTPGTVIAVRTGAGRYAKMRVNSYGYNLGISWVTYN